MVSVPVALMISMVSVIPDFSRASSQKPWSLTFLSFGSFFGMYALNNPTWIAWICTRPDISFGKCWCAKIICTRPEIVSEQFCQTKGNSYDDRSRCQPLLFSIATIIKISAGQIYQYSLIPPAKKVSRSSRCHLIGTFGPA